MIWKLLPGFRKMGVDTIRGLSLWRCIHEEQWQTGWGMVLGRWQSYIVTVAYQSQRFIYGPFKETLRDDGIYVDAFINDGKRPMAPIRFAHVSIPSTRYWWRWWRRVIIYMLNLCFYQIAASTGNRPATSRSARAVIRQLIKEGGTRSDGL